jgi:hypothetical protein
MKSANHQYFSARVCVLLQDYTEYGLLDLVEFKSDLKLLCHLDVGFIGENYEIKVHSVFEPGYVNSGQPRMPVRWAAQQHICHDHADIYNYSHIHSYIH